MKPGDTIHARIKVLEKRETSNPERGVMKRELKVLKLVWQRMTGLRQKSH